MPNYGALTKEDVEVLELVLSQYRAKTLRFLELGVYAGNTARGVRDWCAENGATLDYWGVESGIICDPISPFPKANFVVGESWEVFFKVPDGIDIVLVDGNHTFNGVVLDLLHYGRKVNRGGFVLCHDCAPGIQYKLDEPNRNYPEHPLFHNAVNDALDALNFPKEVSAESNGWRLTLFKYHPECVFGGMKAFQKL